jgi:UDP-N-acetylglucosamine diphosphorylase / glucose-1-phosphate thymidylyltransferase / UDP-N-acetylgalactosamine diphosphorylase / glucosamine-1-phosphate N-acetyltransferase / galactosamine-1-phosphate N-acetyltransferase
MHAVIFAAGESTRTAPLTLTRPKPLLPVANRPILEHQLDALDGIAESVVLVVGYRAEMIRDRFGEQYGGISIRYIEQRERRGTGHALLQCRGLLDDTFIAINGDDIYDARDMRALAEIDTGGLATRVANPANFGVYQVDEEGNATGIVEKPSEFISDLANIGAYRFTPAVFPLLEKLQPSERGEIEITAAIQLLIESRAYRVVEIEGDWLPIGYPWDLLTANKTLLETRLHGHIEGEVHPAAHIEGTVAIGRGTEVRPGVVIDGPVIIGENCEIGPNAWIRPYSAIGDHCKIGQGSEIKGSILMNGARVPHLSYVGDSVLGEKVNFGCGTITANYRHDGKNHRSAVKGHLVDTGLRKLGTICGDGVHTGINTSIYPGRKLWPNTSTLPGEIVERDKDS